MLRFTPCKFDDGETDEIGALLTPPGKGDNSSTPRDENQRQTTRRKLGRFLSFEDVKRSLFPFTKRPADSDDTDDVTPVAKKIRVTKSTNRKFAELSTKKTPTTDSHIRPVVNRLSTGTDVIADGSRRCTLPTISGRHSDLKSVSTDTVSDVLRGCYDDTIDHVTIIDCRYPYEYEGGHIEGAINLHTREAVQTFLTKHSTSTSSGSHVLIFHCEFSIERGPTMCRFLRSQDRALNAENYPELTFPEVYLLHGGYQAFFGSHKEHCNPPTYRPMLHKDHAEGLKKFRAKSRSWSAGDKRKLSRVTLRF